MTSGGDFVRVDVRADGVGVMTLCRPDRRNALSSAVAAALGGAVASLAGDPSVRALVLTGEGRGFCAGADITELDGLEGPVGFATFVSRLCDALDTIAGCPKPSVAALHGAVLGGGLELALACDLRVADETARLGFPEIKLGLLPGASGTARLPRLIPKGVARHMLLTGIPIDATTAHRHGLVNEVVPAGGALDAAVAIATELATLPPLALAAAKRLLDEGTSMPLHGAVLFERETVSTLFSTDDRAEGIRAFLDKRAPTFEGH